jgi:hypothetical protein
MVEVRIWRTGNLWGDTVLSFELLPDERSYSVVRKPQVYTRNVPSSLKVPGGSRHELPFDLGDGEWEAGSPLDQLILPGAQLVAIYDVPQTPEALEHGVWTGQLRSEPVFLDAPRPS